MGLGVFLAVGLLLAAPRGGAGVRAPSRQKLLPLGTRPVAFQGSAMLSSYYMGISGALQKCGVIRKEQTVVGGLSGGSYIAAASVLGISPEQQLKFFVDAVVELLARFGEVKGAGLLNGHLNALLQEALMKHLPDDAAARLNSHARIAMAQLDGSKTTFNDSASWVVTKFSSKRDVVWALLASNYIPCMSGGSSFVIYRNQPVIDGGYANGFSQLCPKGNLANCVKIATQWIGPLGNNTCDPAKCSDCNTKGEERSEIRTTKYANAGTVDSWPLYDVNMRCPEPAWDGTQGSQPRVDPYPLPPWVPQHSGLPSGPDIHPGKYNPLPMWNGERLLGCEWRAWAMNPPTSNVTAFILEAYKLGELDGTSYCAEQNMTSTG